MQAMQLVLWGIGLILQILVLSALSAGAWRTYLVASIYVGTLFVTTLTDIAAKYLIETRQPWILYYWSAELIRQTAMFAVVTDLAARVLPQQRARRSGIVWILLAALTWWLGSLLLLYSPDLDDWMNYVVRNLSFGTSLLTLALWFGLIRMENRDARDLALAGGLGLQMTGEAMGQALRTLFPSMLLAASLLIVVTHFLCMLVWWQAFARRQVSRSKVSASPPMDSHHGRLAS
ncbi:MAG TPA: hypothetical protein VES20_04360 [Bryobacteraceae bacterium]|nr:hypothetical protein [Bryobacteraceae bacterium]